GGPRGAWDADLRPAPPGPGHRGCRELRDGARVRIVSGGVRAGGAEAAPRRPGRDAGPGRKARGCRPGGRTHGRPLGPAPGPVTERQLAGVLAPIATPFDRVTGDIAPVHLRQNVVRLIEAGLDGVVVAGSTGEGPLGRK